MESYAKTCRFILSCNYSSKIIDPIQSRCAIYRFRPLAADAVKTEIGRIAAKEASRHSRSNGRNGVHRAGRHAQGDKRAQGAAIISAKIERRWSMRSPAMHGPRRSRNFSGSRLPVISKGLSPSLPLLHEGDRAKRTHQPVLPGTHEDGD